MIINEEKIFLLLLRAVSVIISVERSLFSREIILFISWCVPSFSIILLSTVLKLKCLISDKSSVNVPQNTKNKLLFSSAK